MNTVILPMPGNDALGAALALQLALSHQATLGELAVRRFPDGETYLRLMSQVAGGRVVLAATLDRPDDKVLPLLFAAKLVREYGAQEVGLVAPYLAYMRQDARFHPGEGVTARYFAHLVAPHFDWLVTVDPHLHRIPDLAAVYPCRTEVVHAAPAIARWIAESVRAPVLIGPDEESTQWLADVARLAEAPHLVLNKVRRGDHDVDVSLPDPLLLKGRTPVLVDDILSTGRTMAATLQHLHRVSARPGVCVAVHAVFAEGAAETLIHAGADRVATCNTIVHPSNMIDLDALIADGVRTLITPS